jgi:antitoxin (DNA-binding transcriptional repressor) of toxin-antitoxin stability system
LTGWRETVAFHVMSKGTATSSIRELRTDFRAVKRKLEEFGRVTITDNGEPAYVLEPVAPKSKKRKSLPDYMARLMAQRPAPMSAEAAQTLHDLNRGDR